MEQQAQSQKQEHLIQQGSQKWNLNLELLKKSTQSFYFSWDGETISEIYPCSSPRYKELLTFSNPNSHLEIQHPKNDGWNLFTTQFYLNAQLDRCKNYVVKFTFHKVGPGAEMSFGLMSKEDKDDKILDQSSVYYCDYNGGTTNKVLKGKKLGYYKQSKRQELRFNISQKQWNLHSLPNHTNVQGLKDPSLINASGDYFLAFVLSGACSISIEDISEVSSFNEDA